MFLESGRILIFWGIDKYLKKFLFLCFKGCIATIVRAYSDHTDLKDVLANKVPYEQERVKKFRKEYGNVKIGETTVDMVAISL